MKKYIINILVFFALVSFVDVGIGFIGDYLQSHSKGGCSKRINDLLLKDQHEVLIMGSSRAYHHYDTPFLSDTLGVDVYNAGYDGNGVILADGLLRMILERYKPRLVVYDVEPAFDVEVYSHDNNNIRYISSLKPYFRNKCISMILKDVSLIEWYKVHSGMIRYNTEIISLTIDNFKDRGLEDKGYSPFHGSMSIEPVGALDYDLIVKTDDVKVRYLNDIIDVCKENNIKLIMVASPKYGKKRLDRITPVKNICMDKGVPFFDYYNNEAFMSHKEWFKEPMHLNKQGALYFSRLISDDIKRIMKSYDNQ